MTLTPNYDRPPGIELRLKWRCTWPDREHDFTAETERGYSTRIYWRSTGSPETAGWFWASYTSSGTAPTAREAAKAVEDAYFEWSARRPVPQQPDVDRDNGDGAGREDRACQPG